MNVGDKTAVGRNATRTLHQAEIDGVKMEVIKDGKQIVSSYPVGAKGFQDPKTF